MDLMLGLCLQDGVLGMGLGYPRVMYAFQNLCSAVAASDFCFVFRVEVESVVLMVRDGAAQGLEGVEGRRWGRMRLGMRRRQVLRTLDGEQPRVQQRLRVRLRIQLQIQLDLRILQATLNNQHPMLQGQRPLEAPLRHQFQMRMQARSPQASRKSVV